MTKTNSYEILLTGDHLYECYRLINDRLSPMKDKSLERFQSLNINCHCWINQNYLLLAVDSHLIYLIDQLSNVIQTIEIDQIVCLLSYSCGVFVATK